MLNFVLINVSLKPGIDKLFRWFTVMRAFTAAFLLGLLAAVSAQTTPPLDASVPMDYEQFGKLPGSYKFHEFATTFWKASKICRAEGAELLVVDSEEELSVVQQLFARFPENNIKGKADSQFWAWVGIHERGVDKNFRTINGAPVSEIGFLRWKSGYPKLSGASDCGVIERGSSLFADDPCEKRYPFICEYWVPEPDITFHVRSPQMMKPLESTMELMVEPGELMVEPGEATVEVMAEKVVEPMLEI